MQSQAEKYKEKGNSEFKAGRYDAAITHYTSAIELKEDKAYYTNRAFCWFKLKKYQCCIDDCTFAINVDAKWAKAYARKAEALLKLGKIQPSIDNYLQALDIESDNHQFRKGIEEAELARSYDKDLKQVLEEGDIEAAIRKVEILLESCEDSNNLKLQLLELWNKNGDMDKTLAKVKEYEGQPIAKLSKLQFSHGQA